jgi:cation:H+ antiporter
MLSVYLFLLAGLLILFLSGKYLVESSVVISGLLRIPRMLIGLTVVAVGTSAPELLVSLRAAVAGYPEIAMGNVVGSNIANILLVLAITAVIFPIPVPVTSVRRDWPIMMFVSLLLFVFTLNGWLERTEGLIFSGLLLLYVLYAVRQSRRNHDHESDPSSSPSMPWWAAALIFVASCLGLAFGADLLVKNAALIAEDLGISQRVISITMVAVGTSIPELATSVIAALKKETEISVGNIIGSNMMNILLVLGLTGIIQPVRVDPAIARFDIPWMLGTSLLLFLVMLPSIRSRISRLEGTVMILLYLLYIYLIF